MNDGHEFKLRKRVSRTTPPSREERENAVHRLFEKLPELSIAEALKLMRVAAAMDQAAYAKLTKVSKPMLAAIEAGSVNPSVDVLNRLGKPFRVRVGFIRGHAEDDE